jgi:hypothetical protein
MVAEAMPLYPVWTNTIFPHSFMLQDVLGSLVAVLAFGVVLYAPGYLVAYATDLFGFKELEFAERSLWAITCSFCIMPIAAYLLARAGSLASLCWLCAVSAIGTMLLIWKKRTKTEWSRRDRAITALLVGGWTVFVLLMLVDFQTGGKLYFSVVTADQSYRVAFTDAVVRTGVPPANPLYFAGSPAALRYYYFWYVFCAAVVKLAHVSARQSFIASSVWAGFGLLATVSLYTRHFFHWGRKQRWITLGLLAVTGADLIPSLGNAILQPSLNGDVEWWSVDPIDAWPDSLLWVPHHVAAVLCCTVGFLFLWRIRESNTCSAMRWPILLTAVAFASAFGLSVYVAFGFALLMLAWLVRLLVLRHPQRYILLARVSAAAVLSAALLVPFILDLSHSLAGTAGAGGAGSTAPGSPTFSLSVRPMIDSGLLTGLQVFAAWNRAHPVLLDQTIRLLLLLPGLAMELGLYGIMLVLLVLAMRRHSLQPDDARDTSLFLVLWGLIMTMFLNSAVITNNDFGYRAVMLPQFFLLLLTADVLGSWWISGETPIVPVTARKKQLVIGLLALGVGGSLYGAFLLRAWLPIEEHRMQRDYSGLPEDAFEIRNAFSTLNRVASTRAVVAFWPMDLSINRMDDEVMTPNDFYQRMLVMNTGRQMLNAEWKCATHFGGDPRACAAIANETAQLYATPTPGADKARNFCAQFGVQYLLISHRDPDWSTTTGWPVTLPLIAREPGFRILQCANDNQGR